MFYHNILQIRENSEGEEGAFVGDSEFRKLSLLLIVPWIPFPLWCRLLAAEGPSGRWPVPEKKGCDE
jgi:hypothetical protein